MTDEERKKIEETIVFTKVSLTDEAVRSISLGFARHAAESIRNVDNEEELYHKLDYWYEMDKKRIDPQTFVERIMAYDEKVHLLTPQRSDWVMKWAGSPILRKALKSPKLRLCFEDDVKTMTKYIQFCENAKNPSQMAKAAITYEVPDEFRYKRLHDALKDIGLNVGTYNNWKHAANPNNK